MPPGAASLANLSAPARSQIANADYALIVFGQNGISQPLTLLGIDNIVWNRETGTQRDVRQLGGKGDVYSRTAGGKYTGTIRFLGGEIDKWLALTNPGGSEVFGTDFFAYPFDAPGVATGYMVRQIKDAEGISIVASMLLPDVKVNSLDKIFDDTPDSDSTIDIPLETSARAIRFHETCFPYMEEFTASGSSNAFVLAYTPQKIGTRRDTGKFVGGNLAFFVRTAAASDPEPYAGADVGVTSIVAGTKTVTVAGANLAVGTKVRVLYLTTKAEQGIPA